MVLEFGLAQNRQDSVGALLRVILPVTGDFACRFLSNVIAYLSYLPNDDKNWLFCRIDWGGK